MVGESVLKYHVSGNRHMGGCKNDNWRHIVRRRWIHTKNQHFCELRQYHYLISIRAIPFKNGEGI